VTRRFAVLASGTGSNAMVLAEHAAAGTIPGELAAVFVDRPDAPVLERAAAAGVPAVLIDRGRFGSRDAHEHELVRLLHELRVDVIVLAGYMRVCGPVFLDAWEGRTINLHPSLLPAFPGRDAIGDALAAGAAETGVTIHFIDAGVDSGPIACQATVAIRPDDDRHSLAQRVHDVEHLLLPIAAAGLVDGRLALVDGVVQVAPDLRDELATAGARVPQQATHLTEAPQPCSAP
jgi:phosphoribosylglycinamide formyltransferase-1